VSLAVPHRFGGELLTVNYPCRRLQLSVWSGRTVDLYFPSEHIFLEAVLELLISINCPKETKHFFRQIKQEL
jgi:hypothetical protein